MAAPKVALVTGGAGFIGSHVVDRLIAKGYQVAAVDSLVIGRKENLHPKATLYQADIRSPDLREIFAKVKPSYVFHLAAQASVIRSVKEPGMDTDVNVLGTINLLEQCRAFAIERFIYSSTGGALYGEPERLPCGESHPIRPLSPYGASKYAAEVFVRLYSDLHGLKHTILRYSNVYGPRQDPEGEAGVVAIFTRRLLAREDALIFGDGTQQRDFVYVADVAEANMKALAQKKNDSFNIGTGKGASVNQVAKELVRLTGTKNPPKHAPARKGEVYKIWLDARKAKRGLGWSAKVGLSEGLKRTVDYFRA